MMKKKKMKREKKQQRKMNYRLFQYGLCRGWGGYSIIELGGGGGEWTSHFHGFCVISCLSDLSCCQIIFFDWISLLRLFLKGEIWFWCRYSFGVLPFYYEWGWMTEWVFVCNQYYILNIIIIISFINLQFIFLVFNCWLLSDIHHPMELTIRRNFWINFCFFFTNFNFCDEDVWYHFMNWSCLPDIVYFNLKIFCIILSIL